MKPTIRRQSRSAVCARITRPVFVTFLPLLLLTLSAQSGSAGSATWKASPPTGLWNSANNWQPGTIPNGDADTATFIQSGQTGISFSSGIVVDGVVFNPTASSYTFTVGPSLTLALTGAGLTNNSGVEQNFVATTNSAGSFGTISFTGTATAGDLSTFTTQPGMLNGAFGGSVQFANNASAGHGTFINNGVVVSAALPGETDFFDTASAGQGTFFANASPSFFQRGGTIVFFDASTANEGTFTARGGATLGAFGGAISFQGSSTAAQGTFTADGGTANPGTGGNIYFADTATAGNATFNINGGLASGTDDGGAAVFLDASTAGNATLIANGTVAGAQGGEILFEGDSSGGTARVELFDNGYLDNSGHNFPGLGIGSLEGDGSAFLGSVDLVVGSNNLSTTFSGVIQDGGGGGGSAGSLTKVGKGTLTLSGSNLYTGGTTVEDGVLLVTTRGGSATGRGLVRVNGGTLSGIGTLSGRSIIGKGSGPGAFLAPGVNGVGSLTIKGSLSFDSDSTYLWEFNTNKARADQITLRGVMIDSAATFDFLPIGNRKLPVAQVFTAIRNTSSAAINGTFANLTDGGTVTVNVNTFQANYEGGDGNDLTLTVVP